MEICIDVLSDRLTDLIRNDCLEEALRLQEEMSLREQTATLSSLMEPGIMQMSSLDRNSFENNLWDVLGTCCCCSLCLDDCCRSCFNSIDSLIDNEKKYGKYTGAEIKVCGSCVFSVCVVGGGACLIANGC